MQKEFIALSDGDELRQRPTNFDFNVSRCKTDKLLEQMTVEKAICVLKVPQTRNSNALDKTILEGCFSNQVYKRIRVNPEDPEYKKKVEGRHVLDLLVHESYQFMMKHVKQQANGIVSVSGLTEEEAKKEEERQREIRRQREEEEREEAEYKGHVHLRRGKKKYVSPAVQRIIEEYWKDDDGDEPDSILRQGRKKDWASVFEL